MNWMQIVITVLVCVLASFAILVIVMRAMASLSGWAEMAQRYPWNGVKLGGITSLAMRWPWCGYNNCIRYATDEDHLHLGMFKWVGFFHAPMSIPWESVLSIEDGSLNRAKLDVEGTHIWLYRSVIRDEIELRASMAETAAEDAISSEAPA